MFQARRSASADRPLSLPRRAVVLLTLVALMLAATALPIAASESKQHFIVSPYEKVEADHEARPLAALRLPNGNSIDFFAVPAEKGGVDGVLVVESAAPGTFSMQAEPRLSGADPLEVFNAFAGTQALVPQVLMDLYGPQAELGPRGWALDLVADQGETSGPPDYVTCPAYSVTEWSDGVDAHQDLYNGEFTSTWDGPDAKPEHWHWTGNLGQGDAAGYKLAGQAVGVSAFYGSVLYCWEDVEEAIVVNGVYGGNYVRFAWRYNSSLPWNFFYTDQLDEVGKIVSYEYQPADAFYGGATKLNFRIEIANAKPADLFHIGAAWQWNGPGSVTAGQ
jgi:hypothetical protein